MCKVNSKILQRKRSCCFKFIALCAMVILKTKMFGLYSISLCHHELVLSVLQTDLSSSSPLGLQQELFRALLPWPRKHLWVTGNPKSLPWTLPEWTKGSQLVHPNLMVCTVRILKVLNGFWSSAVWIPGLVCDSEMPPRVEGGGFSIVSTFPHFYLKSRPERNASLSPRISATVLSVRDVTQLGYLLGFFEITFDFKEFRIMEAAKTQIKDNLLKHVEF